MFLIIGGVFQGKLNYAKMVFNLSEDDIYTCSGEQIDFSKRCIYAVEEFVRCCMENGNNPVEYFARHRDEWENSILICQDMFCGVVPVETDTRAWRQETGLLSQYLAQEAASVIRVFCGLGQTLK